MVSGLEELGIVDDDAGEAGAPKPVEAEQTPIPEMSLPEVLGQVPLFSGLLPAHLKRMGGVAKMIEIKKNAYVFKHGDPGDGLYVVRSGAIRISRNASGLGEEALAIIREGGHFGEMSLIDDDVPRSADAIAHETTMLVKLPKDDMRDLLFVDRELAYELLWRFVRTLSGRLRESNDRLMMLTASSKF